MHATRLTAPAWILVGFGIAAFAVLLAKGDAPRAWSALLAGLSVPLFLAVGALFFTSVHSVCGARWTVPFQRLMEGVGAGLPLALLAFLALGSVGLPYVYEWAEGNPARDSLFRDPHGSKALWMTDLRFLITGAAILSVLVLLARALAARSHAITEAARSGHIRWSVITLVLLVPLFTLLTWDTLLSLHVQFTSAIFGGYCLVTCIHVFLGALALTVVWLARRGLAPVARPHLLKDLGTWLVAFSCIVAYISYVQYVIIAFTNLDEETHWYLMRVQHGYGTQAVVEICLRCIVPFVLLMSQSLRAKPWALAVAGSSVLIGTWLELHWLVVPAFSPNHYRSPIGPELLVALGFLAGTFLLAVRSWRSNGLLPMGDYRLLPAINAEHVDG
jgi:hypothetical protein